MGLRRFLAPFNARPVEAAVAFAVLISSIYFLLSPEYRALSVVGRAVSSLDTVWAAQFALGGLFALIGLMFRRAVAEAMGYTLIAGGLAVQVIATVTVASPVPVGARAVSIVLLGGLAIAFLKRAHTIIWGGPRVE